MMFGGGDDDEIKESSGMMPPSAPRGGSRALISKKGKLTKMRFDEDIISNEIEQ
jgi:hypothetical protein